jgi:hypothetical protein
MPSEDGQLRIDGKRQKGEETLQTMFTFENIPQQEWMYNSSQTSMFLY